jgi:hypothetical protein
MPQLKPTRGICLNRNHPLSRGLVGLWLFNEGSGSQVFDLSGNGRNCTFGAGAASPAWSSGKYGSCLSFDGADYASRNNDIISGLPVTIVTRARSSNTANIQQVVSFADNTTTDNNILEVRFRGDVGGDPVEAGIGTAASAYANAQSITGYVANEWIDIAATFEAGITSKIYINGIFEANDTDALAAFPSSANEFNIGARPESTRIFFLTGKVSFVYIFNRALSASEIAQLYREPFCMFEEAMRPKLIGGQIVDLAGSSIALSSLNSTAKVMRKVGGNVVSTTDVTAILKLFRSLLYIESNWKRESLFNGMTANAFKLGTTLSLGWFWVRVAGCSVLYRGSSMEEIDFMNILAVAEQDACEISPPSYISHNSGSTYFYVVRRFNNCGYQECTLAAAVKVSIESNGELAEPRPNNISSSKVQQVDSNKIQLVWFYCPIAQKSQPVCFNVYYDDRKGQIDYENPLATIGYKGRKFYSYQCGALEAGRYLFAIRTEDTSGIENSSLAQLRIQFDPTNPEAIDILSAEGV